MSKLLKLANPLFPQRIVVLRKVFSFLILLMLSQNVMAEESGNAFLDFIKKSASQKRSHDQPPASLAKWKKQKDSIRKQLLEAWGGFPKHKTPLEPQILGTLKRDGYRIEKIIFQTLPDVWMTANAYVPNRKGKLPAVLCVHGHWRGAKQDPHVQARCIGLAKLGYFVLVVDAFGAGERGLGKALGEYHGEMVAATLFPIGTPLSGLQVYENGRAVDYLLTRKEVDGTRLGITGASGGGNQSMYAGAWDERFKAVVPVCSVGNYQAYLGTACCMCEVVPAALQFTEEWGVLGLTAPRALMVINATRDGIQFSVPEAKKSIKLARPIYDLYDCPEKIRHTVFESKHDYNQPMREAMYGWMSLYLKEEGDGTPIPEPEINLEPPETLRCFPGETRPDNWLTIPEFAYRQGKKIVDQMVAPVTKKEWQNIAARRKKSLNRVLGATTPQKEMKISTDKISETKEVVTFEAEPGIVLSMHRFQSQTPGQRQSVVLLNLEQQSPPAMDELKEKLLQSGFNVVIPTLRATGDLAWKRDKIGRAVDHNTAEWSLWLGRPLLGQWVLDVRTVLSVLESKTGEKIGLVGYGPAGVVAICAAGVDARIQSVVTVGSLSSYLTKKPYENQRLGTITPGLLRDAGDIPHLAALVAPRKLILSAGVNGQGKPLSSTELQKQFEQTHNAYEMMQAEKNLSILHECSPSELIKLLK